MPLLDSNILRDEENTGFQPGTQDDDSFEIENMPEYPGMLADFGIEFNEEEPKQIINIPEQVKKVDKIEEKEPTVQNEPDEDFFDEDEENIPEYGADDEEDIPLIDQPPTPKPVAKPKPKKEEKPEPTKEETASIWDLFEQKENIPIEDEFSEEDFFEEDVPLIGEEPVVLATPVSLPLDNALKELLEEEITRSKKYKEEIDKTQPKQQVYDETEEEMPEDISDDGEIINFSDIDAERPSTYGLQPLDDSKTEKKSAKKKEPKIKPIKEPREKNRFPFKVIGYWMARIAASLVLLSFLGFCAFNIVNNYNKLTGLLAFTYINVSNAMSGLKKVPENFDDILGKHQNTDIIEHKPLDIGSHDSITKTEPLLTKDTSAVGVPQSIAFDHSPEFYRNPVENRKYRNPLKSERNYKENKSNKLSSLDEGEGVYAVQIYSSPSKKDAEEWLGKLNAKNVASGFITSQTIRDKIWYRVRFGSFKSRDEARLAALKFGFPQSWIDRVK
ncbi:MAG: hypothetical protein HW421_682 [Ignavibacteria bacterium]|nr:hypothetical protein [Ignavibacteria bacterium]